MPYDREAARDRYPGHDADDQRDHDRRDRIGIRFREALGDEYGGQPVDQRRKQDAHGANGEDEAGREHLHAGNRPREFRRGLGFCQIDLLAEKPGNV